MTGGWRGQSWEWKKLKPKDCQNGDEFHLSVHSYARRFLVREFALVVDLQG